MSNPPHDLNSALAAVDDFGTRPVADHVALLEAVCAQLESTLREAEE